MHKLILGQLKKYKVNYIMFAFIYLIDIIMVLLEPVIFGKILDQIIINKGTFGSEISRNIMLLILILLAQYVLNFIYRRIVFATGKKVKQGVLNSIVRKLEKSQLDFFEKTDKGSFVSYIINDISYLWSIMSHGAIELIRVILYTGVGFLVAMTYVDFSLTLAYL